MKVTVPNLQKGAYAEMVRENGHWTVFVDDAPVTSFQDGPDYAMLSRTRYKILGVESDHGTIIRYAPLHRHSDCSLLDGMSKIKDIVAYTEYAGALTDHGVMYGFLEYYNAMKDSGKQPIIGFEGYMENLNGELAARHVIFLAKTETGVKNLFKLTSGAYDHFKRRPQVTWEMMEQYHEDVICLSSCLAGLIPSLLLAGDNDGARRAVERFLSIYGDDFYIEIQRHHIEEEDRIRGSLVALAKEYGVKVVATTDSHYTDREDDFPHEVLLCLQTGKTLDDPSHFKMRGDGYHLMDSEEMEQLFADYPEALDNTLEIAEKCAGVTVTQGAVNLPKYEIPAEFASPMDYLEHLVRKGFRERFEGIQVGPEYMERLNYELNMIRQMNFAEYFIIVTDFITYAKSHDIYVGPGRGSATGSMVAFCLGITDLDPIKYNLLFERFLNPERVSWPDIDTDFEDSRRSEVIQYVTKKYGAEHVCRIVTFGTLAAKRAVLDVGRCLGKPAGYNSRLAKMIPSQVGITIDTALEISQEFRNAYETDDEARRIIDIAKRIEGNKRHASQHACGLVLSPKPVSDYLPTSMEVDDETKERSLTSQVIMTEVELLSLIKMDLLGLKNMGVIHEVIIEIVKHYGKENILKMIGSSRDEVRYQDFKLTDRETFMMMSKGLTEGVFQFESEGMKRVLADMLSDIATLPEDRLDECFERLIAAVALYRPGPMDYIPNYIQGMRDESSIHYLTPELEPILRPTYGTIVYQEQVMQIVQKLAGYSLGRADLVRKAMGKKRQAVMDAEKQVFIYGNKAAFEAGKDKTYTPGCIEQGISEGVAQEIWAQMADFAKYAFNRSHAACYAFIAYITAYMSCHWPCEFYAALLNSFIENSKKVKGYLAAASHRGIQLLPPDINLSGCRFTAENGNIRFGLQGISGVKSAALEIVEERENGPFVDMQEFYERMANAGHRLSSSALENLIYSGAFAVFSDNKAALCAIIPKLEKNYKSNETNRELNQISLFSVADTKIELPDVPRIDERVELEREGEVLGMFLSRHPTDDLLAHMAGHDGFTPLEQVENMMPGQSTKTAGLIRSLRTFYTKKKEPMCSFTLESRYGSIPCVVFPRGYQSCLGDLYENRVVLVSGNVSEDSRGEGVQFIVEQLQSEDAAYEVNTTYKVNVKNKEEQERVLQYVRTHPGTTPVVLMAKGREYMLPLRVQMSLGTSEYLSAGYRQ